MTITCVTNFHYYHITLTRASSILVCRRTKSVLKPIASLYEKLQAGDLYADENQLKAMSHFEQLFSDIENYSSQTKVTRTLFPTKTPKGLYLHGAVGRGKTMLMDIFYDCCQIEKKRKTHFNEFMTDVHLKIYLAKKTRKGDKKSGGRPERWNTIAYVAQTLVSEAWLLCLDEFQVTDIGDAMLLKSLFTELFKNGMVLVTTSNRPPDDLYKNGLQRANFLPFIPILKNYCVVVNLDSPTDYRAINVRSRQKYYFIIGQEDADEELDLIFRFLASKENDQVSSKTILVKGRKVTLKKVCGRVLDATFTELCKKTLGLADYLLLAQLFHTIIIRNVPKMGLNNRNETRRFTQLIDILYNYKVRIAVSAEVSPQQLFSKNYDQGNDSHRKLMDDLNINSDSENAFSSIFTGSDEIFAFKRTVSRLMEMQTTTYWDSGKNNFIT